LSLPSSHFARRFEGGQPQKGKGNLIHFVLVLVHPVRSGFSAMLITASRLRQRGQMLANLRIGLDSDHLHLFRLHALLIIQGSGSSILIVGI
jgi:hypothetical protein